MKEININVQVLEHGKDLDFPSYETEGSSGMDVRAAVEAPYTLKSHSVYAIPTGLKVAIPHGYEIQIRPRSGLALKHSITCLNTPGTIDADYRGEVKIILANLGNEDFIIERGMRIAQAVVCPVIRGNLHPVESLDSTNRGEGGFGSTGV